MVGTGFGQGLRRLAKTQIGVLVGAAVLVAFVVTVPSSTGASTGHYGHAELSCPAHADAASTITVSGVGFAAGAIVVLTFDHLIPLRSATASGQGSFTTSVVVPRVTGPGPHTIEATAGGHDGRVVAACTVQVTSGHG